MAALLPWRNRAAVRLSDKGEGLESTWIIRTMQTIFLDIIDITRGDHHLGSSYAQDQCGQMN